MFRCVCSETHRIRTGRPRQVGGYILPETCRTSREKGSDRIWALENQPNAYSLYESDGWEMLRVLPRDDGTFYLANKGGMSDKHFKPLVTKDELAKMKRKHKLFRKEELQQQTTIDEFLF